MDIRIKRVYDDPEPGDGVRILVDGIWPRGVSKEDLRADRWLKEVAPSTELRKWFDHDPEKWDEFKHRYTAELEDKADAVRELVDAAESSTVTLLFAASDTEHNQAVVLKEYLES